VQHHHSAVPAAPRSGRVCLFVVDSPRHIALRSSSSSSSSDSDSDSDGQLAEQVVAVPSAATGNESVPIQLAQCWFTGLEAILSNSTRKLLRFEIAKMLIAV